MSALADAIALVERVKAEWDRASRQKFDSRRYTEWRAAYNAAGEAAVKALLGGGAVVTTGFSDGTALRLAGIRSTSTTGIGGAMGNWLIRARARMDGAA